MKRMSVTLRAEIYARDGGVCQICRVPVHLLKGHPRYGGADDLAEIDHIIPWVDGGRSDPKNLQLLCKKCNRRKAGVEAVRRRARP